MRLHLDLMDFVKLLSEEIIVTFLHSSWHAKEFRLAQTGGYHTPKLFFKYFFFH